MEILNKLQNMIKKCIDKKKQQIIKVLRQYSNDEQIKKVIQFVYSGNRKDKIDSTVLKSYNGLIQMVFDNFIQVIQKIVSGQFFGKKVIQVINGLIKANIGKQSLIYKIFDGDLGIQKLNKRQICQIFNVKYIDYDFKQIEDDIIQNQDYLLQKLCEGQKIIYKIWFNQFKNKVQIFRQDQNGIKIEGIDNNIIEELKEYYTQSKYYKQSLIFIGNLYIKNIDVKKQLRKKRVNTELKYQIYDFMLLDQYLEKVNIKSYLWRRDKMLRLFFGFNGTQKFRNLSIIFSTNYSKEKFNLLIQRYIDTGSWNGIILKSNTSKILYKYVKYNNNLIGIVKDINIDSKIIDDKEKGKYQVKYVSSLSVQIQQNKIINISNGIQQDKRFLWYFSPSQIIGKKIQIKCSKDNKQFLYKGEIK